MRDLKLQPQTYIDHAKTSNVPLKSMQKHQVCQRATFPEDPQTSPSNIYRPHQNIDRAFELCEKIDHIEISSMQMSDIP